MPDLRDALADCVRRSPTGEALRGVVQINCPAVFVGYQHGIWNYLQARVQELHSRYWIYLRQMKSRYRAILARTSHKYGIRRITTQNNVVVTALISPEIEIERSGQVRHDVVGIILPLFVMVNALIQMPRARAVGSFRLASRPMPANRQAKGSSK